MDAVYSEAATTRARGLVRSWTTSWPFWVIGTVIMAAVTIFATVAADGLTWFAELALVLGSLLVAGFAVVGIVFTVAVGVACVRQRDEARQALRKALDRSLAVRLESPRTYEMPPRWLGLVSAVDGRSFYRLTAAVHNDGPGRNFEAVVLPPVVGTSDADYGNFYLQWDLTDEKEKWIPRTQSWKVHIAAARNSTIAFLAPPPYHHYKIWEGDRFEGTIAIRGASEDASRHFAFVIEFDDDGFPTMTIGAGTTKTDHPVTTDKP